MIILDGVLLSWVNLYIYRSVLDVGEKHSWSPQ